MFGAKFNPFDAIFSHLFVCCLLRAEVVDISADSIFMEKSHDCLCETILAAC